MSELRLEAFLPADRDTAESLNRRNDTGAPEVNGRHMPSRQPWNVPVSVACAVAACAIACAACTPADPAGTWSGAENW